MAFEARIYIQGAGVHVPGEKHRVLFPNQRTAENRGLLDLNGEPFCPHHAVVQVSSHALRDQEGDLWRTYPVEGQLVGVDAVPPSGAKLPCRFTRPGNSTRVPGLSCLEDLIGRMELGSEARPSHFVDRRAIPGEANFDASLLAAAIELEYGVLSPATEYEGQYNVYAGPRAPDRLPDETFASVVKVELGVVERLSIWWEPLGGSSRKVVDLDPTYDEVEVWFRHFCELGRPDPRSSTVEPEDPDRDFALNYALLESFDEVLERKLTGKLPIPRVSTSWVRGGPIGGEPANCGGTSGGTGKGY